MIISYEEELRKREREKANLKSKLEEKSLHIKRLDDDMN
jgi:hypothetical protein